MVKPKSIAVKSHERRYKPLLWLGTLPVLSAVECIFARIHQTVVDCCRVHDLVCLIYLLFLPVNAVVYRALLLCPRIHIKKFTVIATATMID